MEKGLGLDRERVRGRVSDRDRSRDRGSGRDRDKVRVSLNHDTLRMRIDCECVLIRNIESVYSQFHNMYIPFKQMSSSVFRVEWVSCWTNELISSRPYHDQ